MHIIDIRKAFTYRNPDTGAKCSPYGSIPPGYTERVDVGWTFGMSNGSVGMGPPAATIESAVKRANEWNNNKRRAYLNHADMYPSTADDCYRRAEMIPLFDDDGAAWTPES